MCCDARRPGRGPAAAKRVAEPGPHGTARDRMAQADTGGDCAQADMYVLRHHVPDLRLSATSVSICGICVSARPAARHLATYTHTRHMVPMFSLNFCSSMLC